MKVGSNVEGCKHKFYKVYTHNLRAFFGGAYTNALDFMSASTYERLNTSKALNLLNILNIQIPW